ncbi:hypothetical protein [Streptomyces spongiae]|uniref:hypothetical protein n=1 Tax=Streptomyces spongiae TaxID=565072 RepID=UPI001883DAB6|nr:hypothetical protein [Streptomyces spongiae]
MDIESEDGDRDEAGRMDLTVNEHVQQHGWHVVVFVKTRSVLDSHDLLCAHARGT